LFGRTEILSGGGVLSGKIISTKIFSGKTSNVLKKIGTLWI
jgi:hypothetical protein